MDREEKASLAATGTTVLMVLVVLPLVGSLMTGNWAIATGAAIGLGTLAGLMGLFEGLTWLYMKIFK